MNRHDSVAMSVVAMSFGDLDLTWWLSCHVISRLSVAHFHQLGPCFVQFFSFSQAHIVAGTIGLAQLHSRIGPLWTITYQQTFKFKLHQIQIQIDTKFKFKLTAHSNLNSHHSGHHRSSQIHINMPSHINRQRSHHHRYI